MGKGNSIVWQSSYLLLYILAAAKLAVMLWSANKGFDLGDEGLYMLSLAEPERYPVLAHGYFLNRILPIADFTIPISRTISIVLELCGGLVFSWGLYKWLKNLWPGASFMAVWALVLMGSFQSILARCVSYNDLINFFGLASAGVLLASFSFQHGKKQFFLWMLSAFLLTFCTVFKAPVAISISFLFFTVAIFYGQNSKLRNLSRAIAAWFAGSLLTALAYTLLYNGFGWMDIIVRVKETADLLNYRPIDLVLMYVIYDGVPTMVFMGLGISLYILCSYIGRRVAPHQPLAVFLFTGAVTIIIGVWAIKRFKVLLIAEEQDVYHYLWIVTGIVLLVLGNVYKAMEAAKRKDGIVITLFLLALPIAMIGGTNGFIIETLFAFWIPWFGLIGAGLGYLTTVNFSWPKYYVLLGGLAIATGFQFYHSKVLHPFGLPNNQSLWHQTTPLKGKDHLMASADVVEYFTNFQSVLKSKGVEPNSPIAALNYMPGLVYLAQGYSPGAPFYLYSADFVSYNCHFLNLSSQTLQLPPVLMYRSSIYAFPIMMSCLNQEQWDFPKNYVPVRLYDPYDAVYEHEDFNNDTLYIWVPKK